MIKNTSADIKWGTKINSKLSRVVSYCARKETALDLGCGLGANSRFLAEKYFNVTSVDYDKTLLSDFKNSLPNDIAEKINFIDADIKDFVPTKQYDLIIALFVLHFFKIETVKNIIDKMKYSLRSGGIIFISVFGNQDEEYHNLIHKGLQSGKNEVYSRKLNKTFHYFEKNEIKYLFKGYEFIEYEEYKKTDFHPPIGNHTHFIIDVVVKKM